MRFSKLKNQEGKTDKVMKEIAEILKKNNCILHVVPDYQIMVVEEPKDAFAEVKKKGE